MTSSAALSRAYHARRQAERTQTRAANTYDRPTGRPAANACRKEYLRSVGNAVRQCNHSLVAVPQWPTPPRSDPRFGTVTGDRFRSCKLTAARLTDCRRDCGRPTTCSHAAGGAPQCACRSARAAPAQWHPVPTRRRPTRRDGSCMHNRPALRAAG
jgi:hypothetical protein